MSGRIEVAREVVAARGRDLGHSESCVLKKASCPLCARGHRGFDEVVTLYSKPDCHLCVEAQVSCELRSELGFELAEVDITTDEALHRAYFERIPVVTLDDEELFEYFVDEDALRQRLRTIL